ncbi:MAG: hypothetical protein ACXU95_09240, partial [Isosphaeraceae bacterium]
MLDTQYGRLDEFPGAGQLAQKLVSVRLTPQKLVSVRLTQRKSNRHQFPIPNSRPPSGKDLLGGD